MTSSKNNNRSAGIKRPSLGVYSIIGGMIAAPRVVLNMFSRSPFTAFEQQLIDVFLESVSDEIRDAVASQILEINYVQRIEFSRKTLVQMFRVGFLHIVQTRSVIVDVPFPVARLCRIRFRVERRNVVADFISTFGVVGTIEIGTNVLDLQKSSRLEVVDVENNIVEMDPYLGSFEEVGN